MIQRHVFVSGRVQGVGFRMSLLHEARKLSGLKGFVRNLQDGRVEAVIQGKENDVLALVAWCRQGPSRAKVSDLEVQEDSVDSALESFDIR